MPITDILERIPQFGRPMQKDKQPEPNDPIEARRAQDVRVDMGTLQDAVETLNTFGAPAIPSLIVRNSPTGSIGEFGDPTGNSYYVLVDHELGYTPNRYLTTWQSSGWEVKPFPYRWIGDEPLLWTDTTVAFRWPISDMWSLGDRFFRVVLFRE